MGSQNISNISLNSITNTSETFSIDQKATEGATGEKETTYQNYKWTQQYGYFSQIADLKGALIMKAIWNVGKGYTCDTDTEAILEKISGSGKDTFLDILFNMEVQKRIGGDAYAEIIRDPDTNLLINLRPLDPSTMRIVVNESGQIIRYEQTSKTGGKPIKFKPNEIFHLSNNRIADNIGGTSDIDALENTILANEEHAKNLKFLMRRQSRPLIIFKLKTDDPTKISQVMSKMDEATTKGNNVYLPDDDNTLSYEVVQLNTSALLLEYKNNLRNEFYRALGLPLVIFGSAGATESGSKMEYLAHEQVFERDQKQIENQIWRQLRLRIVLNRPTTMLENLQQDAQKDGATQQINVQPSDMTASRGK